MEAKKRLLTYAGLKALEDELENLKVVKRKEVAQKIKEAITIKSMLDARSKYLTRHLTKRWNLRLWAPQRQTAWKARYPMNLR